MAGFAKTNQVLLSTATVMVGPMEDLHELNPAQHSLGLVKNVTLTTDFEQRELTQGIRNDVVMSVTVNDGSRLAFEVYEYTLRNLAYAAGLDGSGVEYDPIAPTYGTATAPSGTTVELSGAPTGISAGDYIYLQAGGDDFVHIGRVASIATSTITLTAETAIPATVTFPAVTDVGKVQKISIGNATEQAYLSAKIVGVLPANNQPVTIYLPKMRITRGLNVSFSSDNYSNMPFEVTPYVSTQADPHYAEFGPDKLILMAR